MVAPGSGRPASTCEAHRSRQFHCHSRRLFLSCTPATASASCFLCELCVGSPLPVREPTSFQQSNRLERQLRSTTRDRGVRCLQTREPVAMRQHQNDDLAECQREGSGLRNDLLSAVRRGAMGPHSVSMALRPLSPSRVRPHWLSGRSAAERRREGSCSFLCYS